MRKRAHALRVAKHTRLKSRINGRRVIGRRVRTESDLLICPRAYPSIRDRLRARAARDSPSWPRMLLRAPSRGGPCGVFVAVVRGESGADQNGSPCLGCM